MNISRGCRIVFLMLAAMSSRLCGQVEIQLFNDFPGASLHSWSASESDSLETIHLVGEHTWTERPDFYRWVHFRAEGMHDRQPEFRIGSRASQFLGDITDHRFVWSYDKTNWSFFDNNGGSGQDFRFSNDEPFVQDSVYVAYSTPYSLDRTTDHVQRLRSQWFVMPTNSATNQLVVGEVDGLPLYGYRITNPLIASDEKTRVVLVGGNHSGEHAANFALEGMIDFLVSDDARARQMRNEAEFFVYPQVDPVGREEGFYRGNSQNPAGDHNRFWDALITGDDGGFAEVSLLSQVMRTDMMENVDYALDFHAFFESGPSFLYSDTQSSETEFVERLQSLEPDLLLDIDDAEAPRGIFEFWAKTSDGLNATYSYTPEFTTNALPEALASIGENYALAMFAELGSPQFDISTTELDVLTRALHEGAVSRDLDLNRDGTLDGSDLDFLLADVVGAIPGDVDLDGSVVFSDFLAVSRSFGGVGGWGDGDFDGNRRIEFSDFLVLSRNYGKATNSDSLISVPEPMRVSLVQVVIILATLCARRRRV